MKIIGKPVFIIDERVSWFALSGNLNAIHLLEQNLDKIHWLRLSANPAAIHLLTKLDTNKMKQNNKAFAEELVAKALHPMRLMRMRETYNLELEELVEML